MNKDNLNSENFFIVKLIRVRGIVQGVGFRPTVWKLAHQNNIKGWVINDALGVLIKTWASQQQITAMLDELIQDPPPLARIDSIEETEIALEQAPDNFTIEESQQGLTHTQIAADAATCQACVDDIQNIKNRRYHYPFTNCTHCGPRLSIIKSIPYDRAKTSMQGFKMCPVCLQEYRSPADRRFHAQPNACRECGPQVFLIKADEKIIAAEDDAIKQTVQLIKQGFIVAIKGIGGIHIACDATNQLAVETLRQRKKRYQKPFALMGKDMTMIKKYCNVSTQQQELLQSTAAPIVILHQQSKTLPEELAPSQNSLGFMLPYTPLHHLLFNYLDEPIVLTSGNISDDPQCIDNQYAISSLSSICDYFLLHDREIVNRLDDSVIKIIADKAFKLRRARGYAPQVINLPAGFDSTISILAMGSELKNTFCLIKDGQAIVSQYMGDLEKLPCFKDYLKNLKLYKTLFDLKAQIIVIDKHPAYLSSQQGLSFASQYHISLIGIQHHHAHITSCMAENGLALNHKAVLGVVFDGLGMGENNELWGGEFLLADYTSFQRLGRVQAVPLLGGDKASKEPWRNIYAQLRTADLWTSIVENHPDLEIIKLLQGKNLKVLDTMMNNNLNSPQASSAGRLFDAAAACLGICPENIHYEGQAAIEMENLAENAADRDNIGIYPCDIKTLADDMLEIHWEQLWLSLFADLANKVDKATIALQFHHSIANAIILMVSRLSQKESNVDTVVLSGGVFQNAILFTAVEKGVEALGLKVISQKELPLNDGGLSFGQAITAMAKHLQGKS